MILTVDEISNVNDYHGARYEIGENMVIRRARVVVCARIRDLGSLSWIGAR